MINREPTEINAFQFIVLPHTGIQICRNFPVNKEIHIAGDDLFEIGCDVMSNACDGEAGCTVRYHNEYCGDPWVNCIKNGRTRWTCIADAGDKEKKAKKDKKK